MGNGDPLRTVRTPGRYRETPQAYGASLGPTSYQGTTFSRNADFSFRIRPLNIQYYISSSCTGLICPSLGQHMTSQIPASLFQNRSPSPRRRDHGIGDGSPALRIVHQLEVEAESWAVAHHIGERSQNRGDSS